jgi:sugar lactone lactonase YvrE
VTRGLFRIFTAAAAAFALAAPAAYAAPGDVWLTDQSFPGGDGSAMRVSSGGQLNGIFTTGDFNNPNAIEMLPDGRILVADSSLGTGRIYEVSAAGAISEFVSGPLVAPRGIDRGPDGTIYVTDTGTETVYKVNPATKAVVPWATVAPSSDLDDIAVARDGSAYVTNRGIPRSVMRIAPDGTVTTFATAVLISDPVGIVLSPDESSLYVADIGSGGLIRIDRGSAGVSQVAPVPDPHGVVQQFDGGFLVTDSANDLIHRVGPTGGPLSTFSSATEYDFPDDITIEPPKCAGKRATVTGTTGKDVLRGSRFADIIATLGGKDTVNGLQGKDIICGGGGRDVLRGGAGNDRLIGGKGNDRLLGGKGKRDRVKGGAGRDVERP